MNDAEFYGKTLKVNYSRGGGSLGQAGRAVWDSDEFLTKDMAAKVGASEMNQSE